MVFRRRRGSKRPLGGKLPRKVVRRTKKPSMVSLIKKTIHRLAEDKRMNFQGNVYGTTYGGNNWNSNCVIPCSPYPAYLQNSQGITQNTRIGNKISTRSLWMRGIAYPAAYNATSNPIPCPMEIRMIFVKAKDQPTALLQSGGYMNSFFQNGSSASAPSGSLSDVYRQVNKELFTVMGTHSFKLGYASYNQASGGSIPSSQYFANNDFKLNHRLNINLTKMCPKTVFFNDNTSVATSPLLQCLIFASYANNENYGPANANTFFKIDYELEYVYEDM